MNLTRVVKGRTFVCDKTLHGQKHAVRYEGEKVIHVSPAVYDLLETDFEQVAKNLDVFFVRRSRRRLRVDEGGKQP